MDYPSKRVFRVSFGISLAIYLSLYFPDLHTGWNSREVNDALAWNYFEAPIPEIVHPVYWLLTILQGMALLGLLLFRPWSRFLALGTFLLGLITRPLMGLTVLTATYDLPVMVGFYLMFVPLVLSFFPPCNEYFGISND